MTTNGKTKEKLDQAQVSILFAAAQEEAELRRLRASNGVLIELLNQTRTVLGDA